MAVNPFGKKSFVGLDIGHHTIKAVQVDKTSHGGWKITRTASTRTPVDSVKESVVVDPHAVAASIKSMLKEAHMSANSANIAVSGSAVVVRSVRIPKMPEATLRKSIKYEAGRYVPSSVEDSYIEFEITGDYDEAQMDVLMVAAPKDIVESRVKACELAGLEVEAVDVEPFAAYRSLVEADPNHDWSDSTIALVDIGAFTTSMSVVTKGVFSMTRIIPQGSQMFTDALKNYFKLNEEDAESGKAQLDMSELIRDDAPKENPPLRVVQPHLDDLIREVRRSLNYFQSQQTEASQSKQVDAVLL
ncbi:MAG TPA: type IV pilus assembly protein PilM, partial [Fimbriimonadaceae bacterium]|nr:type IV pilus assembly protein PilM [Fimbriimonadaceae bacterium]